jgi:hypothetical protein
MHVEEYTPLDLLLGVRTVWESLPPLMNNLTHRYPAGKRWMYSTLV